MSDTQRSFREGFDPEQHRTNRTKSVVLREIDEGANRMTEGATYAQKYSAFLDTDEGRELYSEYRNADEDPRPAPTQTDTNANYAQSGLGPRERIMIDAWTAKAKQLRERDPSLSEAASKVKVFEDYPQFYDKYRRAQQLDRQERSA